MDGKSLLCHSTWKKQHPTASSISGRCGSRSTPSHMLAPNSRYVTPLLRPKDAPILAVPSTFLHTSTRYHRELGTIEQSARCSRLLVPRTLTPVTQPLGIATVSLGCNQEIHPSPGCCRVEGVERPNRKKKYTPPVAPGIFQGRKKRELEARWPKDASAQRYWSNDLGCGAHAFSAAERNDYPLAPTLPCVVQSRFVTISGLF